MKQYDIIYVIICYRQSNRDNYYDFIELFNKQRNAQKDINITIYT